jgi:hypothetical protein
MSASNIKEKRMEDLDDSNQIIFMTSIHNIIILISKFTFG